MRASAIVLTVSQRIGVVLPGPLVRSSNMTLYITHTGNKRKSIGPLRHQPIYERPFGILFKFIALEC